MCRRHEGFKVCDGRSDGFTNQSHSKEEPNYVQKCRICMNVARKEGVRWWRGNSSKTVVVISTCIKCV